jgi:phosphoglycerate dehydrogenase-like enzyme
MNALIVADPLPQTTVFTEPVRAALARRVRFVTPPKTAAQLRADPSVLREVECLFSSWGAPTLDRALLAAAPKLKVVFYAAGSIRHLVTPEFWERKIRITSAAEANAIPVAAYTCAAIVLSLKHDWPLAHATRSQGRFPPTHAIPGIVNSTVGLISLSRTGRAVAQLLQSYPMRVLAYDPFAADPDARALGAEKVPLEEIFAESDVVSLHGPLLPETVGMIHGGHFRAMKSGATFINTARGAIVREAEMIEVLEARPDLTALLDVTEPEPPAAGSKLYSLPNVVLTPHVAGAIDSERSLMGNYVVEELERYLARQPLRGEIDENDFSRLA